MLYAIDEQQLLRVWSVIRCFQTSVLSMTHAQAEILTKAQILLTAFAVDLQPLDGEQITSSTSSASPEQMVKFLA
jgi:hypothetical protein